MDNLAKITKKKMVSVQSKAVLTFQQLLITAIGKPTSIRKEKSIIVSIASFTTTPTQNTTITPDNNYKRTTIGDLITH